MQTYSSMDTTAARRTAADLATYHHVRDVIYILHQAPATREHQVLHLHLCSPRARAQCPRQTNAATRQKRCPRRSNGGDRFTSCQIAQ